MGAPARRRRRALRARAGCAVTPRTALACVLLVLGGTACSRGGHHDATFESDATEVAHRRDQGARACVVEPGSLHYGHAEAHDVGGETLRSWSFTGDLGTVLVLSGTASGVRVNCSWAPGWRLP